MTFFRLVQVIVRCARLFFLIALVFLPLGGMPLPAYAQAESGITSPAPGSIVSGDVPIIGTATSEPFQK